MATEKEYAVKVRALLLLKAIVENPFFIPVMKLKNC